jgi:hypothetical protein
MLVAAVSFFFGLMFEGPLLGQTLALHLLLQFGLFFWFTLEGPALGQTHAFHLVMQFSFSFGLCLRVQ